MRLLLLAGTHVPLRARDLPPEVWAAVDGASIVIHAGNWVHETGPRAGRKARADARFPLDSLILFGHSHIPWDTVTPAGKRLLNPGSPTDRRSKPACTYMTAIVTDDGLSDVTLHSLPVRHP